MNRLAPKALLLLVGWVLPGCTGRNPPSSTDVPIVDASAGDAPPSATRTGAACTADDDCGGLACLTTLERACSGPVRPHTWRFEFAGGYCHPPVDLARGDVPGGCPPGTGTLTAFVGCDGIPFRFCVRGCTRDGECREGEGYRCNLESMQCYPAQFVGEAPDAGADGG